MSQCKWKGLALLVFAPLVAFGCGDFEQPGTDCGSIFAIEQIDPVYFSESTRQVDVFRDLDCADDPENPEDEPYTDHLADITFSNRPLTNSEEQTATRIDLQEYQVWYTPITQGSPDLDSFNETTINDGNGIDPCEPGADCEGETVSQLEFVDVRVKEVLRQHILDTGIFQLEYNIHYRFFGVNDFDCRVSAEGSTFFYAADYDNCGGGGGG
jgi:hypothetical protein